MMLSLSLALTSPVVLRRAAPVVPPWVPTGAVLATDLANNRYWSQPMATYSSFDAFVAGGHASFARASTAYQRNAAGNYVPFAAGQLRRIDGIGSRVEGAASNLVPNAGMVGAAVGLLSAGGSLPTGWMTATLTTGRVEIVSLATLRGLPAVRIRINYTNSTGGNQFPRLRWVDGIPTATGEQWTAYALFDVVASSIPISYRGVEGVTSSVDVASRILATGFSDTPVTGAVPAGTTALRSQIGVTIAAGQTWTAELVIAAPQLVKQAVATSPIITTGSAATRAADALTLIPPASGPFDWIVTFDNDSTQTFAAHTGPLAINPAALSRPIIKQIVAEAA